MLRPLCGLAACLLAKQRALGDWSNVPMPLQVLRAADDWPGLNEHILLLAKRRSQLKQAVQAFVRQAMGYVDEAPDEAARVELIKTLQSVTEGKVTTRKAELPAGLFRPVSISCRALRLVKQGGAGSHMFTWPSGMQIYVEIERARLTKRLAKIREAEGKVDEAADTLQEVAVVRRSVSPHVAFPISCMCVGTDA